jgi:hypothetical protein
MAEVLPFLPVYAARAEKMKIALRVDRDGLRRWHMRLAERIAGRDARWIVFQLVETGGRAKTGAVEKLFQIETRLFGLGREGVSKKIGIDELDRFGKRTCGDPDLIIDVSSAPLAPSERVWRVECDGASLEAGMLAAILSGRAPVIRVIGPRGVVATARPGAENVGLAKAAFEEMLERVVTLIDAALDGRASTVLPELPQESAPTRESGEFGSGALAKAAVRRIKQRAVRAAYTALCHAPHWRTGWRRQRADPSKHGLGGGWSNLPDDGKRFYADPFPVDWRGRMFLFVEEFEHAKGKGIISVVEFGANGPIGAPRPVLERPEHLSYPNVFERDGEMWMIPESGTAGTIDLYRATSFPDRWTHEATLISGVVGSDATLIEWNGRWWMFATVRDGGGAFSDALHLWSAPDFRGPWTPHAKNPVLIDMASARPAGRMFFVDGRLYRPVQDCRAGYGAALGLARVDKLDDEGFEQTVEEILRPGADWPGRRLHTANAAGGFEFIDGSAFAPRWSALRRPMNATRKEGRTALATAQRSAAF